MCDSAFNPKADLSPLSKDVLAVCSVQQAEVIVASIIEEWSRNANQSIFTTKASLAVINKGFGSAAKLLLELRRDRFTGELAARFIVRVFRGASAFSERDTEISIWHALKRDAYPYLMDRIDVKCSLPATAYRYSDDAHKREMLPFDQYLMTFVYGNNRSLEMLHLQLKQFIDRTTVAFNSVSHISKSLIRGAISRSELPPDLVAECARLFVDNGTIRLHAETDRVSASLTLAELVATLEEKRRNDATMSFRLSAIVAEMYRDGDAAILALQDGLYELWLHAPACDTVTIEKGDRVEVWASNDWSSFKTWQSQLHAVGDLERWLSRKAIQEFVWDNRIQLHTASRHRDLHCGNVLACESGIALIDIGDTAVSSFLSDAINFELSIWTTLAECMSDNDLDALPSFIESLNGGDCDVRNLAQSSRVLFVLAVAILAIRGGIESHARVQRIQTNEIYCCYCLAVLCSLRFASLGAGDPKKEAVRMALLDHWRSSYVAIHVQGESLLQHSRFWPSLNFQTRSKKRFPPEKFIVLPSSLVANRAVREVLSCWADSEAESVFLLEGITGAGKSLSSWMWAHYDVNPDPKPPREILPVVKVKLGFDGVFWWSFDPRDQDLKSESVLGGFDSMIEEALQHFRSLIEPIPASRAVRSTLDALVAILEDYRFLLVIDGLEGILQRDPQFSDSEEHRFRCSEIQFSQLLRRLASTGFQSRVLITSQLLPTEFLDDGGELIRGVRHHKCNGYEPHEARRYLGYRVEGADRTLDLIAEHYSYHPATLSLVAAHLSGIDAATVITRFEHLHATSAAELQVRTSQVLSSLLSTALTPVERYALEVLASFRTIGRSEELQDVLKLTRSQTETIVLRLASLNLVSVSTLDGDACYRLHTIVYSHVNKQLRSAGRKQELHRSLATLLSTRAMRRLPQVFRVDPDKFDLLYAGSEISQNIESVSRRDAALGVEYVHQLSLAGDGALALQFYAERLHLLLYFSQGNYGLCASLLSDAYQSASQLSQQSSLRLWACSTLGLCNALSGQSVQAIQRFEELIELAGSEESFGSILRVAWCNLGKELLTIGRLTDALGAFRHGKQCVASDDTYSVAVIEDEIGLMHAYLGNWEEADLQLLKVASAIPDSPRDHWLTLKIKNLADQALSQVFRENAEEGFRIAVVAMNLEESHSRTEHYHLWTIWVWAFAAIDVFERSRKTAESVDPIVELSAIRRQVELAIDRCRNSAHHRLESHFLILMGRVSLLCDQVDDAMSWARQAAGIASYCGYRLRESAACLLMAEVDMKMSRPNDARHHLMRAMNLAQCPSGLDSNRFSYVFSRCDQSMQMLDGP